MSSALIKDAYDLHARGRREDALARLNEALLLAPRDADVLNARGMVLDSLGRHPEALQDIRSALAVRPDFPDALNNRGIHHARVGEFEKALSCYERSLSIDPEQPHALYNRATTRLSLGDWLRGFSEFESRWRIFPLEAARLNRLKPVWLGERDVAGKVVLLHHEQGYGDTLQFSRYAALVMRLGARVIVAVPAALRRLMQTLPGRPRIVSEGEAIPEHDYCCSLMSLPHVFCTTPDTVPGEIPYLHADVHAAKSWGERLGRSSRPRIGLVWTGRRYPPINYPRDMSLDALGPLLALDADFVCLQTDLTESERELLASTPHVVRYGDSFKDFADTAALIENLDLVITVDTAVAHLAGALGKPVWLMNRYASCWRWMQKRADTPWYPRMRLFRQPAPGDWTSVVREVCKAATVLLSEQKPDRGDAGNSPEMLLTLLNEALAEHHRGHIDAAVVGYRRVLAVDSLQPEALHFLGIALAQLGRHEEALASLSLALRFQPDSAAVHNHYGNALVGLLRREEALRSYQRAIELDGACADAHYNCGSVLSELGRYEEAVGCYERAIALDPPHVRGHNNIGNALHELHRYDEALTHYELAVQLDSNFSDAWVNCANTLRRLGRYQEALARTESALACRPGHPEAHSAHGATLASMGRYDDALSSYQRALELKPHLAEAMWNEALAHLARGSLREGWMRYEARWKVKSLRLTQYCSELPPWLGRESIEGKTILLHAEQGYGDSIQFCRYAPLVAARGARVVLGVPSLLRRLMGSLAGIEAVVAQAPLPEFDCHCPLLSLPLAFETELVNIPASVPYLHADPAAQARWRARMGDGMTLRVGLAWSGRESHTNDRNRSIALDTLLPLMREDVEWVSVQKEIRASDIPALAQAPGMCRLGEDLVDFAEAAALLAELDLVITVDTAIAHLAGALGKPVWILLPRVADWRWLQERDDSPWYPTARLFRQQSMGDWTSVIERVAVELDEFCREHGARNRAAYTPAALARSA